MKNRFLWAVALLLPCLFLFLTCDEDIPADTVETSDVTDITMNSATLYGRVDPYYLGNGATVGFILSTSPNPSLTNGEDLRAMEIDPKNRFFVEVKGLKAETTYYFKAYLNTGTYKTGEVKSFTTNKAELIAVDLGLSVKWGSCNLGAALPEDYGDRYAWGELEPKKSYSWDNYRLCKDGNEYSLTKYNTSTNRGPVDNKVVLESSDDVARKLLGGTWRVPTKEEQEELIKNCLWTWAGNGYKVTSKTNGKSIFLPTPGRQYHDSIEYPQAGFYWSSTLYQKYSYCCDSWLFYMDADEVEMIGNQRFNGLSIRPVME